MFAKSSNLLAADHFWIHFWDKFKIFKIPFLERNYQRLQNLTRFVNKDEKHAGIKVVKYLIETMPISSTVGKANNCETYSQPLKAILDILVSYWMAKYANGQATNII